MAGSGLQETLELIYAPNAVVHMMSGKAIARAIRGHFLVDAALNALLVNDTLNFPLSVESQDDSDGDMSQVTPEEQGMVESLNELKQVGSMLQKVMEGDIETQEVCCSKNINAINEKLEARKCSLESCRTAALLFEYMKMQDIVRCFIKVERTGNWKLHLQALYEMLPYFAAAGHNLYTKSAHIYLQQMQELHLPNPEVNASFTHGFHVIRRSDRFWAGLPTDLAIEQVLMRSIKATGGRSYARKRNVRDTTISLAYVDALMRRNQ